MPFPDLHDIRLERHSGRSLHVLNMMTDMTYNCCFCGKPIEEKPYTLTVSKEGCETEQTLYCHEACLEKALSDPKLLYLKCL